MLFPSVEDPVPNAFDDFLNDDLYDLSDNEDNKGLFKDNEDLFSTKPLANLDGSLSPIGGAATQDKDPLQPWRKGLWCLNQERGPNSEIVVEKRRNLVYRNPEAFLRPKALRDKLVQQSPGLPPLTSSHLRTRNVNGNLKPAVSHQTQYARANFSREVTLSPSPMYAQLQYNGKIAYAETWHQDLQNFHLRPHDSLPISPPLSGNALQHESSARQINTAVGAHDPLAADYARLMAMQPQPHSMMHSDNTRHPLIDPGLLGQNSMLGETLVLSNEDRHVLDQLHDYGEVSYHPVPTWATEDLESSDSSYDAPSYMPNGGQVHSWWPPPAAHHPQASAPTQEYYASIAAPKPQRVLHQILRAGHEPQNDGLGVYYPEMLLPQSSTVSLSQSNAMASYPPLPPPTHHHFMQTDPFSTPHRNQRQHSPSRSPSPSVSPTNTSRTLRQRSPSRSTMDHSRRKSIHKSGPIRDRESSKPPRTPKTPKTQINGDGGFDFVNFTPKDSAKLLSDVAPSGSSKTRARREQEAKDKRKRLSEAAFRAVRRAGGDLTALENAILT